MKSRLQKAGLLFKDNSDPEIDISVAWDSLSRLGYPARYGGKAQDGSYEYVIIDPQTGGFLATGKGATLEKSMCQAALNAVRRFDTSELVICNGQQTNAKTASSTK